MSNLKRVVKEDRLWNCGIEELLVVLHQLVSLGSAFAWVVHILQLVTQMHDFRRNKADPTVKTLQVLKRRLKTE